MSGDKTRCSHGGVSFRVGPLFGLFKGKPKGEASFWGVPPKKKDEPTLAFPVSNE